MSAEQHNPISLVFEKLFHRPVIKQFDPYNVYEKFENDIVVYGIDEAKKRRRSLLENNLRTYVQEAIGDKTIFPYATRVTLSDLVPSINEEASRIVFQNLQYNDVLVEQYERLESEPNAVLKEHFQKEFELWERVWRQLVEDVVDLVGANDPSWIKKKLLERGSHENTYSLPKATDHTFNADPFFGLRSLFPTLRFEESIDVIELPKPLIFASPTFPHYHDGKTTIARHARIIYIPKINEFCILSEGFFTAYPNADIAKIHLLGENPQVPETSEQIFNLVQVLSETYRHAAPSVVFAELEKIIGRYDPVTTGKNVIEGSLLQRDLSTQIDYLEKIFELESSLIQKDPQRRERLAVLLKQPTEQAMHTALRSKNLDVDALLQAYAQLFTELPQDLRQADKKFALASLGIHADFATRVVSLVDCGTGTILGGTKTMQLSQLASVIGVENASLLSRLDSRTAGIESRDELIEFCRQFNKDPSLYSAHGTCVMCGKETFIWPREKGGCNVCPVCEVKDDLGIHGNLPSESKPEESDSSVGENTDSGKCIDVGDFVCSMTSGESVYSNNCERCQS